MEGLFNHVGLWTDIYNAVDMTYQLCCTSGQKYEAAYDRQRIG